MTPPAVVRTAALFLFAAPVAFAEPLREMSTDRPDVTESPYTVEPGYLQLELSLAEFTRDSTVAERRREWSVAPLNLRIGLTQSAELQLIVDPWRRVEVRDRAGGATGHDSGRGDVTVRTKLNLRGNDGEGTAFGLIPFVTLPTGVRGIRAEGVEGGLVLPFDTPLPAGWDLSVMSEIDLVRNERDDGYEWQAVHSASFGHDLGDRVGVYLELATTTRPEAPLWTFDVGVTYAVTTELQLDAGVNLGLNAAADDLIAFVGIARRF